MVHRKPVSGELTAERGNGALADLADLGVETYPLLPLLPLAPAAWRWRDNISPYHAMYVALAVELDVTLLSTDDRLCRAAQALGVDVIGPD